jgi:hypothetical protein
MDGGQEIEILNYRISQYEILVKTGTTNVRGFTPAQYVYYTNAIRRLKRETAPYYGD